MQFNISALLVFALAADALTVESPQLNSRVVVERTQPIKKLEIKATESAVTKQANLQLVPRKRDRAANFVRTNLKKFSAHVGRHDTAYTATAAAFGAAIIATLVADRTKSLVSTIYSHGATFFNDVGNTIASYAKRLGEWVNKVTTLFFGFVRRIMTKCGMEKVAIWTDAQWQKFKEMMLKAAEDVKRASTSVIERTKKVFTFAANGVTAAGQSAKGAAAGVGAKVAGGAKGALKKTANALDNAAESAGATKDKALTAEQVADKKAKEAREEVDAMTDEALGQVKQKMGEGLNKVGTTLNKAGDKVGDEGQDLEVEGAKQEAQA